MRQTDEEGSHRITKAATSVRLFSQANHLIWRIQYIIRNWGICKFFVLLLVFWADFIFTLSPWSCQLNAKLAYQYFLGEKRTFKNFQIIKLNCFRISHFPSIRWQSNAKLVILHKKELALSHLLLPILLFCSTYPTTPMICNIQDNTNARQIGNAMYNVIAM